MLAPACLRVGLQPFDVMFVDDADLSPIVLVPLSILLPNLGYGAAIEPNGLAFPRNSGGVKASLSDNVGKPGSGSNVRYRPI